RLPLHAALPICCGRCCPATDALTGSAERASATSAGRRALAAHRPAFPLLWPRPTGRRPAEAFGLARARHRDRGATLTTASPVRRGSGRRAGRTPTRQQDGTVATAPRSRSDGATG